MFRSPSGFKATLQIFAVVVMATMLAASTAQAQSRHETNANRRARIAKTIKETYTHRWEVAGGGGYLRFQSGQSLQRNSEISFFMDTTYYFNQKLGLTGELRGNYGNAKIGNSFSGLPNPQISEYPFLAGPTYRFHMTQHTAISAFALGGVALGKFDGDTHGFPATQLGLWPSTNARPAFSLGLNYDINIYPNLAFRIAPNYTATTFGGKLQNNAGFEMGLVYRFGRQK